jgi:crotonobetainyl-CoA:carnitine CoA-transferase CaiB-like acyl-CoA transferase
MDDKKVGPLTGLKVVDVSIMAAGPWTGALLGMLGAEVIKVEPPDGDGTRWVEPTQHGMGTNFMSMNVNKKDIVLDLKSPADRAKAMALIADADIFVQNFRVGVIERLGFDFETLHRHNPKLIYCAISGFGEVGPLHKAGCADYIMQAFSGFARSNGPPEQLLEAFRFTGFLDLTTASVATEAVLAALYERETSGLGQKVEVSMLEAALEIQASRASEYLGGGWVASPGGSSSPNLVPDRAFGTLDNEIFLTCHNDHEWQALCRALGQTQWLEDKRFTHLTDRLTHREVVESEIARVMASKPAIWWLRTLERHGVPCGLAYHFENFRHHQQVHANDMIAQVETRDWGTVSVSGVPWHFSQTPGRVTEPPRPGEHNEEIFAQLNQLQLTGVPKT